MGRDTKPKGKGPSGTFSLSQRPESRRYEQWSRGKRWPGEAGEQAGIGPGRAPDGRIRR